MQICIWISKLLFKFLEPTECKEKQPSLIPQVEIAVASPEDESEANVICEQWVLDLLINVFKLIEEKNKDKQAKDPSS